MSDIEQAAHRDPAWEAQWDGVFDAGIAVGREQAIREVVAWLHGQRPEPFICDCVNGDMNLDWAADQLEHGALDATPAAPAADS